MANSNEFESRIVDIGTIVSGSKKNEVFWKFKNLTKEGIAKNDGGTFAIVPACGCTADIEVQSGGIKALYNDGGKNKGDILKRLSVFTKDTNGDIPLKKKNNRGVKTYNFNHPYVVLSFAANVQ